MSVLAKLTVSPLLYASGVLLVALVCTGAYAAVLDARVGAAAAQASAAAADRDRALTERDAWKGRAGELKAANTAYGTTVTTLQRELAAAQREAKRIDEQGRAAVAAAQAAAADAERTLARMAAQFQAQAREPDCARALAALEQACPAMGGY